MVRISRSFFSRALASGAFALGALAPSGAQAQVPGASPAGARAGDSPMAAAAGAPSPIVIVLLVPDSAAIAGASGKGVTLGSEEAAQTAKLLGRTAELRVLHFTAGEDVAAVVRATGAVAALSLLPAATTDSLASVLAPAVSISLRVPADSLPHSRLLPNVLHVLPPDSARHGGVAWHAALERYGAQQLNQRYEVRFHEPMSEPAWLGWFAVKAITETMLRSPAMDAGGLAAALRSSRAVFDGHKGAALRFAADGQLQQPLYAVDQAGKLVEETGR